MQKLFLLTTLVLSSFAATAGPIVDSEGMGAHLTVERLDINRVAQFRVRIQEWQARKTDRRVISAIAGKGFAVGESDTIEFLIPAEACVNKKNLIRCDTRTVEVRNEKEVRLNLLDSRNLATPVLQFSGQDLIDSKMNFSFSTKIRKEHQLDSVGDEHVIEFLEFHSNFWLYQDDQVNGHFNHDIYLLKNP